MGPKKIHVSYRVINGLVNLEQTKSFLPDKLEDLPICSDDVAEVVLHLPTRNKVRGHSN
jgi:hypothetical protein